MTQLSELYDVVIIEPDTTGGERDLVIIQRQAAPPAPLPDVDMGQLTATLDTRYVAIPASGAFISSTYLTKASRSVQGIVKLATEAEDRAGTLTTVATTPAGLRAYVNAALANFDGGGSSSTVDYFIKQDMATISGSRTASPTEAAQYDFVVSSSRTVNVADMLRDDRVTSLVITERTGKYNRVGTTPRITWSADVQWLTPDGRAPLPDPRPGFGHIHHITHMQGMIVARSQQGVQWLYRPNAPDWLLFNYPFIEGSGQQERSLMTASRTMRLGATTGVDGSDPTWLPGGGISFDGGDYAEESGGVATLQTVTMLVQLGLTVDNTHQRLWAVSQSSTKLANPPVICAGLLGNRLYFGFTNTTDASLRHYYSNIYLPTSRLLAVTIGANLSTKSGGYLQVQDMTVPVADWGITGRNGYWYETISSTEMSNFSDTRETTSRFFIGANPDLRMPLLNGAACYGVMGYSAYMSSLVARRTAPLYLGHGL